MAERRKPSVLDPPRPGAPPTPLGPRAERFVLDNGLRVVAVARNDLPQIAARLVVPAGSALDPPTRFGTASLVGSLLTEGTNRRSAIELNERIDSLGASICVRVGHDFAEVDLGLLSETLEEGLELFAEVLGEASFPDREVERLRAEALDALDARGDEPANVADDRAALAVFGPDHPYGRLSLGTNDGVRALRSDYLAAFHARHYRPAGSVLVIAGDLDVDGLARQLERCFQGWTGSTESPEIPRPPSLPPEAGALVTVSREDAAQAEIRIAGAGLPRGAPEWIPAAVANYILGGSTITGRLGANLREAKGWTYGVRSGFAAGVHPAGWTIETAVAAESTAAALEEIEGELDRIVSVPVDEDELYRAKEALILSLPRAFETPSRIVARLATVEAFGLDPEYWNRFPNEVRGVTQDGILAIARRFFSPDLLARVTVGPPGDPWRK
jgi:zinc protease